MQYLRKLPAHLWPDLETIVLKARRGHRLAGHRDRDTARAAALAYALEAFCDLVDALCEAVRTGRYGYLDLSATLDRLQRDVAADAYTRAELSSFIGPLAHRTGRESLSLDGFERQVAGALAEDARWGLLQDELIELASTAGAVTTPERETAPALPSDALEPPGIAADEPIPELVSIATAADRLGIHEDTIRRMAEREEIQIVKIGKRVQVPLTELARLCQTGDYPKRRP